jgi:hypothetical protein
MAKTIKSIVATTHIDRQNTRITREALEGAAESVNNGNKPMFGTDHDVTLPPSGKVLSATVELRDDGEYQLVTESEIFDQIEELRFEDGTILYRQESILDKTPFSERYKGDDNTKGYEISIDPVNFENFDDTKRLITEIQSDTGTEFSVSEFGRKSAIPDPEIVIKISEIIVGYLLAKDVVKKVAEKVVEKLGDAFADDIVKFYSLLKSTVLKFVRYARPTGRPITYIFIVPTTPEIEFVARTTDPNSVLSALILDKLEPSIEHAKHFGMALKAVKLQYLLNENGEWEFNYLLTNTGGTIGTKKAFENRAQKIEMMIDINKKKKNRS